MEERKHIVILAAGDFPTHEVPLRALREADFVVCCDSAYVQFSIFNSQFSIPFIVIGDGDSLPEAIKAELGSKWVQVEEQDFNDLHKAMTWATSQFSILHSQFSIIGATGRREDHTLGNLAYLATFAEEYPGAAIELLTDYGRFVHLHGERTFSSHAGQQVSIVSFTPDMPIYGSGLKWPLDGLRPRFWWQATLNEALGSQFTLRSDGSLLVFQTYP
ncbi:MAG: thiamine diphosphokinase [Bacteroidales bacterium]|nr:thiamine diphosphokinase [Bacteroidales bacterium]